MNDCIFCALIKGESHPKLLTTQEEIIYQDEEITAWINPVRWGQNAGLVVIVPNEHFENIYDIPDDILAKINILGKRMAIAMKKAYKCDGISTRQHNEKAGNQDIMHFHLHVIPRYEGDDFYVNYPNWNYMELEERMEYVEKMKKALD